MSSRKLSASIFTVGCCSTNSLTPGRHHHHGHGDDDGRDHHRHVIGHADGGDDRSSENTMSSSEDLHDDASQRDDAARRVRSLVALQLQMDFVRALGDQEQPPTIRIRSRPLMPRPKRETAAP
jgi:hypothetical protein